MTQLEYQREKLLLTFRQKQLQIDEKELEIKVLETNLRNTKDEDTAELIRMDIAIRQSYIKRLRIEQNIIKKQIAELEVKIVEEKTREESNNVVEVKDESKLSNN